MTIAPPRRTAALGDTAQGAGDAETMKRRLRIWALGGGALILVLAGYWYFNHSGQGAGPRAQAAPVRVASVEQRDMAVIERSLGTVVANTTVQLTARVQGTLEKANFSEGQFVRKGDLLFQIDPRPFQAALAQAQAVYRRDQAQLANAQRDKERYANLQAQGAISTQQRDTSQTNADVIAATVAADKAAVDMAQLNLEYTQIRSPVNGNAATAALVTIAEVKPIKISFTLPQTDLGRIQARQKTGQLTATLDVAGGDGAPLSAPTDFVSNIVSNQSGTIELRATFNNDDLVLVPGQLVNVTVQLGDIPGALVVPRDAVNDSPNGSFVFVVQDGKAIQRLVNVLFDDGTNVALSGAIAAGDSVVIEGQLRVTDGGPVHVLGAKAGAGAAALGGRSGRGRRGGRRRSAP